jgi:hypothetical protein
MEKSFGPVVAADVREEPKDVHVQSVLVSCAPAESRVATCRIHRRASIRFHRLDEAISWRLDEMRG